MKTLISLASSVLDGNSITEDLSRFKLDQEFLANKPSKYRSNVDEQIEYYQAMLAAIESEQRFIDSYLRGAQKDEDENDFIITREAAKNAEPILNSLKGKIETVIEALESLDRGFSQLPK